MDEKVYSGIELKEKSKELRKMLLTMIYKAHYIYIVFPHSALRPEEPEMGRQRQICSFQRPCVPGIVFRTDHERLY